MAGQPFQSTEGLSLHGAGMPTHALFLAGVEGGFLSPATLLPLLALPADSITEQFLGRGMAVSWGETLYALLLFLTWQELLNRKDSASDSI